MPELQSPSPLPAGRSGSAARGHHNVAIGQLRAFATLLVIAHHAFLGYVTFLPAQTAFDDPSRAWQAFPILDASRWPYFDLVGRAHDGHLLSLMFFLSGLL